MGRRLASSTSIAKKAWLSENLNQWQNFIDTQVSLDPTSVSRLVGHLQIFTLSASQSVRI